MESKLTTTPAFEAEEYSTLLKYEMIHVQLTIYFVIEDICLGKAYPWLLKIPN